MGPTAAGKTATAMTLFDHLPIGLISVDSAQVYCHLDIGSAKPSVDELARYPHALINLREPEDTYSAADFVNDAEAAILAFNRQGRLPVLVGGTVLYYRAILYGLDALPAADPALRATLTARAERDGWEVLYAELQQRDPVGASVIRPADRQRILRGLELLALTGRGPGHLHSHNRFPRFQALRLVLTPADRSQLHARIDQRLQVMFSAGFVDEVRGLRQRPGLSADSPAMRAVGYRQVWRYLDGEGNLADCRHKALAATRQLAKRQLTALRQFGGTLWYDSVSRATPNRVLERVSAFITQSRRAAG